MSRVCPRCRVDGQKLQEEIARLRGDLANERQHVADMREGVRQGAALVKLARAVQKYKAAHGSTRPLPKDLNILKQDIEASNAAEEEMYKALDEVESPPSQEVTD